MEREYLIEARHLHKAYTLRDSYGRKREIKAVEDVSIAIKKGETCGLVGESGCGKSTLGRCMIGMDTVNAGQVFYRNEEITCRKKKARKGRHEAIQIIFQDPYASLDPQWSVAEILNEPMLGAGMSRAQRLDRALELLEKVGLEPGDLNKYPFEFSGGQRQRIGIARALAVNPEFIVCDEPLSALDVSIQAQIVNLLQDLQEEYGLTYLFTSHDLAMVHYISDSIGVMYLGRLVEFAPAEALYTNPMHPYTKTLLESMLTIDVARFTPKIMGGEAPDQMKEYPGCNFAPRCGFAVERCVLERPKNIQLERGHFVMCHRVGEL